MTSTQPDSQPPVMLVVDDEEGPRLSLQAVFHGQFTVLAARNSNEAMAIVAGHRVSVAILDIKMEGESGLDLLRRVRQADPMIECIMLSAFQTLDYAQQALRAGATGVMSKPFDLHDLTEAVARAMRLRRVSELAFATDHQLNASLLTAHSTVIHNLGNLLTVVNGYVDIVRTAVRGRDHLTKPEIKALSESLDTVASHTATSLEMMSRFLRVTRGGLERSRSVSPGSLLPDLAAMIRHFSEGRNCRVRVEDDLSGARVPLTGGEFSQLVLNLGRNAVEAAPGKKQNLLLQSQLLALDPQHPMLREGPALRVVRSPLFTGSGQFVMVRLQDEAGGISLTVLPRLLEPYYTTKPRGSGIGLNYVAQLVREQGGCLSISTVPGTGTSMAVFFPVCPPPDRPCL